MNFRGLTSRSMVLGLLGLSVMHFAVRAAVDEPEVAADDLPRVAPIASDQVLQAFQIKDGFQLELVASEPLVMDPIALSFDENGRLFVVEMRDYSERRDEHLGRIRMLEDTDGDGRFDKATVFADNLAWPTAVLCYNGGVFVGSTPDILFLKDEDKDGHADTREVLFTGFGKGVERLNVQQLVNSFAWGLDNRVHGANGGNGGSISSPTKPGQPALELRGRDFSFDPRTHELRAESGGGQYGLTFDSEGRKFVCSNSSHIRAVMYDNRYSVRNPYLTMPAPALDIAIDGPAAEVYRISPEEPWRVIRTKWRVAGLVPGPVEGGGRASGYFTSATGITVYTGDAWSAEYRDNAFIADCGSNLVHRKKVAVDGIGFKAERPQGEEKVEFLASRDLWFRPVQMANAPDGTLYVIDMYREVIEHPWSFPASIKKHLDLNSGNDRGRIYRIVPKGFRQRPLPQLSQARPEELVKTLEHPNGWHRNTAARLLFERQDVRAIPLLREMARSSRSDLARFQALWCLQGLSALRAGDVAAGLLDPAPSVRRHALRLLEGLSAAEQTQATPDDTLDRLVIDPNPEVRYQLAFTLGSLAQTNQLPRLLKLFRSDGDNLWMRSAVLNTVNAQAAALFEAVTSDPSAAGMRNLETLLKPLLTIVGVRSQQDELNRVLTRVQQFESSELVCSLAAALGEGVQRAGTFLYRVCDAQRLDPILARARQTLAEPGAKLGLRLAAVRVLGQGALDRVREPLMAALEPEQPGALQQAALERLAAFPDPSVPGDLLSLWSHLTPTLRAQTIDALLRRPERVRALLSGLESGTIRHSDLAANQVEFLRRQSGDDLRERAVALLGQAPAGARQGVIAARRGVLTLPAVAARGRDLYLERCATCHRLAGQGHALGPDLETVRASGKEMVLANIIDPNREVTPKYVNYLAETREGDSFTGLVGLETETSVVLRQASSVEVTLLRSTIRQFRSLGQSAMPEGLEEGLSDQNLADLIEYVLTATPSP